ncbi:hypothetical protein ABZ837_30005 [Streptomyces sp. NPDC047197]|uniref:hypothetical protein n=1 Tax=Streptomyces sp. NPDC047197 TaxID=3155477 RepID=UPI0033EAEAFC
MHGEPGGMGGARQRDVNGRHLSNHWRSMVWMAEHQIERAHRDRFTRAGSAEKALRQHDDFLTGTSPRTP